jgi:hypothetical protein
VDWRTFRAIAAHAAGFACDTRGAAGYKRNLAPGRQGSMGKTAISSAESGGAGNSAHVF